jgi:hypothetical protein
VKMDNIRNEGDRTSPHRDKIKWGKLDIPWQMSDPDAGPNAELVTHR